MPIIPDLTASSGNRNPAAPSPQAAAAPGLALAAVGREGFALGEAINERLQLAQDSGAKNTARLAMQQAFQEHQIFRAQNPDESTWGPDMEGRIAKAREAAFKQRMSPFMKTELDATFQGWAQQSAGAVQLDASKQGIARARQNVTNTVEAYIQAGMHDDANAVLRESVADKVMLPEEAASDMNRVNADQKTWQEQQAEKLEINAVLGDPKGWLEANPANENYPPGTDFLKINRLRAIAVQKFGQQQHEFAAAIRDGMVSQNGEPPRITKPEQITEEGRGIVAAATIEILKGELADRHDAAKKAFYFTPEQQNRTIGELAAGLADFQSDNSTAIIGMEGELEKLPPGPIKNFYSAELTAKLRGDPEDTSPLSINRRLLDDAFKGGAFGEVKPPEAKATSRAINDGFLRDPKNLAALGYGDAQAAEIIRDPALVAKDKDTAYAKTSDAYREKRFQQLWENRKNAAQAKPDAYTAATAEAILQGSAKINHIDPAGAQAAFSSRAKATKERGRIEAEIIKWSKAHPKADADAIREEMYRLIGPAARGSFLQKAFGAAAADDSAGMVLPPRAAPDISLAPITFDDSATLPPP